MRSFTAIIERNRETGVRLTSITTGKAERYDTPTGTNLHRAVSPDYYRRGVRIAGGARYARHEQRKGTKPIPGFRDSPPTPLLLRARAR